MKHTTIILSGIAIAASAISCSSDQPELVQPEQTPAVCYTRYRVSPEEALDLADNILKAHDGNTRAARTVASFEILGAGKTRGNSSSDTLLYLINYADNNGFALVSTDKRARPVYAYSDTGHLSMSDTIENKGLACLVSSYYDDAMSYISLPDSAFVIPGKWPGIPGIIPDKPVSPGYHLVSRYGPLLSKEIRRWHQKSPFNYYCPLKSTPDGQVNAPVGCTALAMGMIMGYFEWPLNYGQRSFDWNSMTTLKGNDDLYWLLKQLGNSGNLDITYGATESGANFASHYRRTFKNFGYKDPGALQDYDINYIQSSILKPSPVVVNGKTSDGDGHVWIIDGVVTYASDIPGEEGYGWWYVHTVWGWENGSCNGYFSYSNNSFDTSKAEEFDKWDRQTVSKIPLIFKNIKIKGNFEPNK